MEEKNEKFSIDTENLKNETVETAKKLKETVKATNLKEETKATKGLITEMFKNPLETIKEVANENSGKYLKTAIFLLAIWTVMVFANSTYSTIYYWGFSRVFNNIINVLKNILAPVAGVIIYSIIILIMNKENKKSLADIISTITITQLPLMLASVVTLLEIISIRLTIITSPFTTLCEIIAIILSFFGIKYLFDSEEDSTFIKKYVKIQTLYYLVYIIISLFGIYI